jgi:peptidyl-prolyl cis-trans isomerase SurA
MRSLAPVAVAIICALAPSVASGQSHGLAAVVNSEPITAFDLASRLRLTMVSLRAPDRPDIKRRLAPQVLRRLIMERLRVQEARRLKIRVSAKQIQAYISRIEQRRGMPKGQFLRNLKRARINPDTVIAQIHAGLAWNQVISRRIAPRVRVTAAEIEEVLARMKADKNRVQYRLREIYLPVNASASEAAVLRNAQQMMNQLRRGAPFAALARQFSGSGTAAVGGDRGQIFEAQLEPELLAAVRKMRPGQIVGPIRTITGYYIIQLIARGTLAKGSAGKNILSIANVGFRFKSRKASGRAKANKAMIKIAKAAKTCPAIMAAARQNGANITRWNRKVPIASIRGPARAIISRLKVGQKSRIVRTRQGIMMFMRCKKIKRDLPTRAAIRRSLLLQKVNTRSLNYLRDLRRSAIIEIRV